MKHRTGTLLDKRTKGFGCTLNHPWKPMRRDCRGKNCRTSGTVIGPDLSKSTPHLVKCQKLSEESLTAWQEILPLAFAARTTIDSKEPREWKKRPFACNFLPGSVVCPTEPRIKEVGEGNPKKLGPPTLVWTDIVRLCRQQTAEPFLQNLLVVVYVVLSVRNTCFALANVIWLESANRVTKQIAWPVPKQGFRPKWLTRSDKFCQGTETSIDSMARNLFFACQLANHSDQGLMWCCHWYCTRHRLKHGIGSARVNCPQAAKSDSSK